MSDPDKTPPETPSAKLAALPITRDQLDALEEIRKEAADVIAALPADGIAVDFAITRIRRLIANAFLLGRQHPSTP